MSVSGYSLVSILHNALQLRVYKIQAARSQRTSATVPQATMGVLELSTPSSHSYHPIPISIPIPLSISLPKIYYLYSTTVNGFDEWVFDRDDIETNGGVAFAATAATGTPPPSCPQHREPLLLRAAPSLRSALLWHVRASHHLSLRCSMPPPRPTDHR